VQSGDEDDDEGGPLCLSKLYELGTFARAEIAQMPWPLAGCKSQRTVQLF